MNDILSIGRAKLLMSLSPYWRRWIMSDDLEFFVEIKAIIQNLSLEQRALLGLSYLGYKHREMSKIMNLSRPSIWIKLKRVRSVLRVLYS